MKCQVSPGRDISENMADGTFSRFGLRNGLKMNTAFTGTNQRAVSGRVAQVARIGRTDGGTFKPDVGLSGCF
jgi:hypothetical protein